MSRRWLLGACLAAGSVLAACGSNSPGPSPTARPTPVATLPPGSDTYPAEDTPVDQAPPAMAATWKAYGATLIPGHSTIDPSAKWPRPVNATGGALDTTQVQAVAAAVMRVQVLATWMDEHRQMPVEAHMLSTVFLLGNVGVAIAEGTSVHTPDCSTYPATLSVHAPSPAARDALVKSGQNVPANAIPLVMSFTGPCQLTGTTRDGATVTLDTLPAARIAVMVDVRNDPVLGPIGHLDAAAVCADPAVASLCAGGA